MTGEPSGIGRGSSDIGVVVRELVVCLFPAIKHGFFLTSSLLNDVTMRLIITPFPEIIKAGKALVHCIQGLDDISIHDKGFAIVFP
jgi:hypothetical protein